MNEVSETMRCQKYLHIILLKTKQFWAKYNIFHNVIYDL